MMEPETGFTTPAGERLSKSIHLASTERWTYFFALFHISDKPTPMGNGDGAGAGLCDSKR